MVRFAWGVFSCLVLSFWIDSVEYVVLCSAQLSGLLFKVGMPQMMFVNVVVSINILAASSENFSFGFGRAGTKTASIDF